MKPVKLRYTPTTGRLHTQGDAMDVNSGKEPTFTDLCHLLDHGLPDPYDYSSEIHTQGERMTDDLENVLPNLDDEEREALLARLSNKLTVVPRRRDKDDNPDNACGPAGIGGPGKSEGFTKFDNGKPRMSLVDPDFIVGLADILTFGAKKYEADNWKLLDRREIYRYKDALLRHIFAYLSGELIDEESGKPHLDCASFNLMALRYFEHGVGSTKGDSV